MRVKGSTLRDIANAVGVSIATVSRALAGKGEITEETKMRVQKYADSINYSRDPVAVRLKERRSYLIGVAVSRVDDDFVSQFINGIEKVAFSKKYQLTVFQSHHSFNTEGRCISNWATSSLDGLLISSCCSEANNAHLNTLVQSGIPMVFASKQTLISNVYQVVLDKRKATFDLTQNLIKLSCKQIAYVTSVQPGSADEESLEGFVQALASNNITLDQKDIMLCGMGENSEFYLDDIIAELYKPAGFYDAVLISEDRITVEFLRELNKMKWLHGHHLRIACFVSDSHSELFGYPVVSVKPPAYTMGAEAMDMLLGLIESNRPATVCPEVRKLDFEPC